MFLLSIGGRVTILVLVCATFVLLLAMVLTMCLSDRVQRNAVFLNFFIVTTINAWYIIHVCSRIAALSPIIEVPETQIQTLSLQGPTVLLTASVSLFSLVLHVATVMRNVVRPMPMKYRKRIDVTLIVIPYLSAPIALLEFLVTSEKFANVISYLTFANSMIATFVDVALLVMFNRYRSKFNQIEGHERPVITNSILIRMSSLCVYRLLTTLAGLLGGIGPSSFFQYTSDVYTVFLDLYPTTIALAFLQKDILSVWIPSLSSSEKVSPARSSA